MGASGSRSADIDAVATRPGPGLVGALLVGTAFGRSLAMAWGVPAIGVHHMEGHLLAPMLENSPPAFPYLALLVSGGHTQLVSVEGVGVYDVLGESVDDRPARRSTRLRPCSDCRTRADPHSRTWPAAAIPDVSGFPGP